MQLSLAPKPRVLNFSIAMDADYSFYVKSIATYAPAFLRYNNSVSARVNQRIIFTHLKFLLLSLELCQSIISHANDILKGRYLARERAEFMF